MSIIRRIILAAALMAGLSPAIAQVPPAVPALPDTERRTTYTISGTTCACAVNFALYGDSTDYQNWVEVFINGTRVNYNDATNGWTITSPSGPLANISRPVTNAVLTFTNVHTGTIQIVGARRPRRVAQFSENRGVAARDLNQALTDIVAQNRETWDRTNDVNGRAIMGPPGETLGLLPAAATRAGKFFTFDGSGSPTITAPTLGTGNVIGTGPSVIGHLPAWTNTLGTALGDSGYYPVQPITCSSPQFISQISALGVPVCTSPPRLPNPGNLYVSTTGNDSNNCLTVGTPCLTIQHAIDLAVTYDFGGSVLRINLAAGTYTSGAVVQGAATGMAHSGFGRGGRIDIVGAGSASTAISTTSNCTLPYPVMATDGAVVGLGSMVVFTSCAGASAVVLFDGAIGYLVDDDVKFNGASNAIILVSNAKFDANYITSRKLTIAGNATYAFAGTTKAAIVTGVGVTNVISGTPAFTAFVSLIDGSFYNEGIGSSWSNASNATGPRYSIALNSFIDREQNAGSLPGSTPGLVQGASVYYQNNGGTSDLPCIGAAGGCRNATAPTGLGTGGTAAMLSGSNDHSGSIRLNIGTTPPTSGTVVIAPVSILTGDYGGGGFCSVSPNPSAAAWPAPTTLQAYLDNSGIHVQWNATVVASASYIINYVCN